ncbi:MAG: hypothetical protein IJ711_00105 [Lachnospiraceae bacterium]|nr:hypothetical protein [Clostridia bacterium]MBR1691157.1 hypothetical protein [Lachnospiraceae bacterium]
MIKNGMTVDEAAHRWVSEFSRYPYDMIKTLMRNHPDDWHEVTLPTVGDRVYVYDESESGEIVKCHKDRKYTVELDNGRKRKVLSPDDFEVENDTILPMWGTLWAFGDSCDDWWITEEDGLRKMSECGFRIYEHDEWGLFFGIDGCGYDFYEAHWIPLYKVRGLQWHDPETEEASHEK